MARQATRALRLAEAADRLDAASARHQEAIEHRLALKAEREAIRLRIIPGTRRLEDTRQEKELFLREKQHEAAEQSDRLRERWRAIDSILSQAISDRRTVFLDDLRIKGTPPTIAPPPELLNASERPFPERPFGREDRTRGLAALMTMGRSRWIETEDEPARLARLAALSEWTESERRRLENLTAWEVEQEKDREAFLTKQLWRDREIEAMGRAIAEGDGEAIATYVAMTLERSLYPEGFPQSFEIGYDPGNGLLVVDLDLPDADIIPKESDFQYIQSSNQIVPVPMRGIDRKFIYQNLIGRIALRTLLETVGASSGLPVSMIGVNARALARQGDVDGASICLVSILTTPSEFARVDLTDSDPRAALRVLGAEIARRTDEDPAVQPLIVRPRHPGVEPPGRGASTEVFADFLTGLLERLGLTNIRRVGSDDSLRFLAFDDHPLIGGKVLVGGLQEPALSSVDAVMSFLDALAPAGAVRGILMTSGRFDLAALRYAQTRPVELVDGVGLKLLAGLEPEPAQD